MKNTIYIVYEVNAQQEKSSFCIKGISTSKREAKEFYNQHKKDYKNDWFLIIGKVENGKFDIMNNIFNEIEEIKKSY